MAEQIQVVVVLVMVEHGVALETAALVLLSYKHK
jgi:hypothetical protein